MDKGKYTPGGRSCYMSKKAFFFVFSVIFFFMIICPLLHTKYGLSEQEIRVMVGTLMLSFLIFGVIVILAQNRKKQTISSLKELNKTVDAYFQKINAEKKNYTKDWEMVEKWKSGILEQVNQITEESQKTSSGEFVLIALDNLEIELDIGLEAVREDENPFTYLSDVSDDKQTSVPELSLWEKTVMSLLVIIPSIFLYLVLSGVSWGILGLTFVFGCFLFPNGLPLSRHEPEKFKCKHLLGIIFVSGLGYLLNQWTYAQSGEVQIAVTVALPIIYAIIYYKLKHKKTVREI
ncbi:MAG: hypothetical protein SPL08_04485 [Pseudomonadota bacterium]|nr:hypothetical protein [Pseudomonadota bacterium]